MKPGIMCLLVLTILGLASAQSLSGGTSTSNGGSFWGGSSWGSTSSYSGSSYTSSSNRNIRGCETYHWTGGWDTGCQTCSRGYYRVSGLFSHHTCEQCPTGCDSCSSNNQCQVCASGYFMSGNGTCGKCLTGCGTCVQANQCLKCSGKYFLQPDSTCHMCTAGCEICPNKDICDSCSLGFYRTTDLKCAACSGGCSKCTGNASCQECQWDYNLKDGLCFEKSWLAKYWVHLLIWPLVLGCCVLCCFAICKSSDANRANHQTGYNSSGYVPPPAIPAYNTAPGWNGNVAPVGMGGQNWNNANAGWNQNQAGWNAGVNQSPPGWNGSPQFKQANEGVSVSTKNDKEVELMKSYN